MDIITRTVDELFFVCLFWESFFVYVSGKLGFFHSPNILPITGFLWNCVIHRKHARTQS